MIRRPPRSTRTDTSFPTRRSSDLIDNSIFNHRGIWIDIKIFQNIHDRFIRVTIELFNNCFEHIKIERSEEHTSELQSLMRISYAVLCLKKKHIKIRYII